MANYVGADPNQLQVLMSSDFTTNSETFASTTAGVMNAINYVLENRTSIIVVPNPTITGSSNIVIGQSNTYTLNGTSGLSNANIAYFKASITGQSEQTITATSGSGTVTFTVPSDVIEGTSLTISVVAYDSLGNKSNVASKTVTTITAYTQTPTIVSPSANSTVNGKSVICNITYNGTYPTGLGTHESTDWILETSTGTVVASSLNDTTNKTSYTFTTNFSADTSCKLKVRVKNSVTGYSAYTEVTFTNKLR